MNTTKALVNTIFKFNPDELIELILEIKINQFSLKRENVAYGLYLYCEDQGFNIKMQESIKKVIKTKYHNYYKSFKTYDLLK
jgi:hypothetical protein